MGRTLAPTAKSVEPPMSACKAIWPEDSGLALTINPSWSKKPFSTATTEVVA